MVTGSVRAAALLLIATATAAAAPSSSRHPLTADDLLAFRRISEPAVSPDNRQVAFTVRDADLAADRIRSDIWIAAIDGSRVMRLTTHPENDQSPAWSPDGGWIYFSSTRSGSSQVWRIRPSGGEAEQVTRLRLSISGFKLLPDGRIVLALEVWPDATSIAASARRDEQPATHSTARIYDQLPVRSYDHWVDGKATHLFAWTPPEAGGAADDAKDLTPGLVTDATDGPSPGDAGMAAVSVSPDGKTVAFVARVDGREDAWHANTDVFVVPSDGHARPIDVTPDNPAYDFSPVFSPDGRSIAIRTLARAGFEADRRRLAIIDAASHQRRVVTERWDRWVGSIAWSRDGRTVFTDADELGSHAVFAIDVARGEVRRLVAAGSNSAPLPAGDRIVFLHDTLIAPAELYSATLDGRDVRPITHLNDARSQAIAWGDYEPLAFAGAHGDTVHGFVVKPAGFHGGKAPVVLLVHGGPQLSAGDHFLYRWNPEVFAGAGFAVVMIDFHGSPGYGQAFVDAVSRDWGGAPYDDLIAGLDAALARYPWLDGDRMVAVGASFGGYLIHWINGKTDRFKALVCQAGYLDTRTSYLATDELWFPEWEHGGVPWEQPDGYRQQNPIELVGRWKTPTLMIHGGLDYRVDASQSMAAFTALQRRGIPSRLLYFPDESHIVARPRNLQRLNAEVIAWLARWIRR